MSACLSSHWFVCIITLCMLGGIKEWTSQETEEHLPIIHHTIWTEKKDRFQNLRWDNCIRWLRASTLAKSYSRSINVFFVFEAKTVVTKSDKYCHYTKTWEGSRKPANEMLETDIPTISLPYNHLAKKGLEFTNIIVKPHISKNLLPKEVAAVLWGRVDAYVIEKMHIVLFIKILFFLHFLIKITWTETFGCSMYMKKIKKQD